jgi:hypothetical protein
MIDDAFGGGVARTDDNRRFAALHPMTEVFERCCLEALKDFCTMASEISIQLEHWKHTILQHLDGPVQLQTQTNVSTAVSCPR